MSLSTSLKTSISSFHLFLNLVSSRGVLAFSATLAIVFADLNLLSNFSSSDWDMPWTLAIFKRSNSLKPCDEALLSSKSIWLLLSSEKLTFERSEKFWEKLWIDKIKHINIVQNLNIFSLIGKRRYWKTCYFRFLVICKWFNIL